MGAQETQGGGADAIQALVEGRHGDPFAILGAHVIGGTRVIRAYAPGARGVDVVAREDGSPLGTLEMIHAAGLFAGPVQGSGPYRLRIHWPDAVQEMEDPYSFGLLLGELDLHLIAQGTHYRLGHCLGAQPMTVEGVPGVRFAVWAPNARRVSVVGDFCAWDGRRYPMRLRQAAGVWELFLPRLGPGTRYKFEIIGPHGDVLPQKADPVARAAEAAPGTASIVARADPHEWTDAAWMAERPHRQGLEAPISVYEVHAGSWLRFAEDGNRSLTWREMAERLVPYVQELGFTHIEFLPIMEHPFGGSWGYQPLGLFAPTGRYGPPEDFAYFVDRCHASGIGVIVDWVPAHFPTDVWGLARFDGTALYEHQDPREGFHQDWNTLIYNLGRQEVKGFILASALEWLDRYHVDALRVDAVASMLYRDYSRKAGEWVPNIYGGRENLESVEFFKHLNSIVSARQDGAITIAEESTAWPGVTRPVEDGGLGFHFKWNMGWMHDTLQYMEKDPIYRQYDHHLMSFGMVYAYSEHFVLPLSHDEVVHGKGSLINKMPGDNWQKFANLRAYFAWMWMFPGKKLLFMGCEIAQWAEWNNDASLDWNLLDHPAHKGMQTLIGDLNRLYVGEAALHATDSNPDGFRWAVVDDAQNSVYAFVRQTPDETTHLLVVSNMTPQPRRDYRIGVPKSGYWLEALNSDAGLYGGSNLGNGGGVATEAIPAHGHDQSLKLVLPPLATIVLRAP
ncbi:1,4-alpha-glucan branching protein GlgB [Lichenifustis flavocetrariae]|uniref:1,4-alpha-glucan branching enzyme GlgB n=1 Tax=Lichenifustis flavocetrariae TaxID=2949735 RepID=A0AA41YT85_9HYPH|nr:1,4-alpha-glucan branching protein GlgB [Lichenifustis flavocetrariae]MCW6506607.1 1,4-alpha-glucan branching protein GlgB [Lichenifustis flavocetrariae]